MPENLYRRGKTWYARFWLNGEEIRRSLRTTSRAAAVKKRDELEREIQHVRTHGESRRTWKEAVIGWAADAPAQIKPNVVKRYLVSLRQVDSVLGEKFVDEIGRTLIAKIAGRRDITNATRRRDLTAVSSVLRWCVAQNWIESNPARDYDRSVIRERRDPIVLPAAADIEAVIAAAPGNLGRLARLALLTGMRQNEIVTLEWSQIDLRRAAINLTKTKTDRPRSVPLTLEATGTITGTARHIASPFVFWVQEGEEIGPQNNVSGRFAELVQRVERAAKKAGRSFRPFRFHDLRHLFAVDYLRRGAGSVYALQKILGHRSIATTEIYLDHLTPDEADRAKSAPAQKPAQS